MQPTHLVERNFYLLMLDAVLLLQASADSTRQPVSSSCARTSLLTSVVALECCANICLAKMAGGAYRSDLDKLPFLSKLDAFARAASKAPLDRGRVEVEHIDELKSLRDAIVHPKPKQRQLKRSLATEDGTQGYAIIGSAGDKLRISNSPADWGHQHAALALKVTTHFLKYYFVELLGYSPTQTFQLLASEVQLGPDQRVPLESEISALSEAAQREQLDVQFLLPIWSDA